MIEKRRMKLKEVLVVRVPKGMDSESFIPMAEQLHEETGLHVFVMEEGVTMESLDEADMANAGWIRGRAVETVEPKEGLL